MRTSADQPYTNLFDIYEAAFDTANDLDGMNDFHKYADDYASGALDIELSEFQINTIVNAYNNWGNFEDKSQHNFYYEVQRPLEEIEINS